MNGEKPPPISWLLQKIGNQMKTRNATEVTIPTYAKKLVGRLLTPKEALSVAGGAYCQHTQSPDGPKFDQTCPKPAVN